MSLGVSEARRVIWVRITLHEGSGLARLGGEASSTAMPSSSSLIGVVGGTNVACVGGSAGLGVAGLEAEIS